MFTSSRTFRADFLRALAAVNFLVAGANIVHAKVGEAPELLLITVLCVGAAIWFNYSADNGLLSAVLADITSKESASEAEENQESQTWDTVFATVERMRGLAADWDGAGSTPPSQKTIDQTLAFLSKQKAEKMPPPGQVTPTCFASVQLAWWIAVPCHEPIYLEIELCDDTLDCRVYNAPSSRQETDV